MGASNEDDGIVGDEIEADPAIEIRPETIARQRPHDGVAPWHRAEQTPDEDDEWPPPRPPEDKGIQ